MLPNHDPVIEAAIRPLAGNAERHQAGAAYLMTLQQAGGHEDEMVRRWDEADRAKDTINWWRWIFGCAILLTVSITTVDIWRTTLPLIRTIASPFAAMMEPDPEAEQRVAGYLNDSQRLLLFGDLSTTDKVARKRALWQSDPNNPAYYAEYALAYKNAEDAVPPDFLETAKRLDPNNAWFAHFLATVEAKDAVKKSKKKVAAGSSLEGSLISWEIKDRVRLETALRIFRDSAHQTGYDGHAASLQMKRVAMLHQGDFAEQMDAGVCISQSSTFSGIATLRFSDAIAARAWLAGEENDPAELRRTLNDASRLIHLLLTAPPDSVIEEIVLRSNIRTLATSLWPACEKFEKFGFSEEADRWKGIEERYHNVWDPKPRQVSFVVDGTVVPTGLKTGFIGSYGGIEALSHQTLRPPNITDADIRPGRLADHEFLSRISCYLAAVLLAIGTVSLATYKYRVTKVAGILAGRMKLLLLPGDWVWILGLGIVLPLVYVMAINRFTPLGGRELGIMGSLLLLPATHFLGLVLLWLLVPIPLIHWRLGLRAKAFGFGQDNRWSWIGIASALAFVPVVGWAATTGTMPDFWMHKLQWPGVDIKGPGASGFPICIATALLAVAVGMLLALAGSALLCRVPSLLHRATVARVLIPIYLFALVLILAVAPLFKFAERQWFAENTLTKFDPTYSSWTRYEYLVAAEMRKESLEILGYDP